MSMLDRRVLGRVFAARLVASAFALSAIGAASLRVDAHGAPQSPGATPTPAPADVRFELASIRRNLEAEQQRAAVPIYPRDPETANLRPAIKPLIEAQHGLTLRDAEAPVEILVIERIDRPTPN